jgi:class 3 adenylate cyclase
MSAEIEQRKLAAIMFTGIVGYSGLAQRDERLALELLEEHRQLLRLLQSMESWSINYGSHGIRLRQERPER